MEKPTGMKCKKIIDGKFCGGEIIEEYEKKFMAQAGLPINGPGSEYQWKDILKRLYCNKCGFVSVE